MPAFDAAMIVSGSAVHAKAFGIRCLCEEAVDSGLEIDDGSEDATFQAPLGLLGEVTLHGVEPGARSQREVEDEAHVPSEPTLHLGMLIGPSCRSHLCPHFHQSHGIGAQLATPSRLFGLLVVVICGDKLFKTSAVVSNRICAFGSVILGIPSPQCRVVLSNISLIFAVWWRGSRSVKAC